jgi:hypothetical protein
VFVVVSRQALLDSKFSTAICAPIYTHGYLLEVEGASPTKRGRERLRIADPRFICRGIPTEKGWERLRIADSRFEIHLQKHSDGEGVGTITNRRFKIQDSRFICRSIPTEKGRERLRIADSRFKIQDSFAEAFRRRGE